MYQLITDWLSAPIIITVSLFIHFHCIFCSTEPVICYWIMASSEKLQSQALNMSSAYKQWHPVGKLCSTCRLLLNNGFQWGILVLHVPVVVSNERLCRLLLNNGPQWEFVWYYNLYQYNLISTSSTKQRLPWRSSSSE